MMPKYPNQINVRESSEMDQADIELRTTIIKCWPHTKRDKIDLLVPTLKREISAIHILIFPGGSI